MNTLDILIQEALFWSGFVALNASLYLVNYIIYFRNATFLPYIDQYRRFGKLGLTASANQDFFRYSVELSTLLILSRVINLNSISILITFLYLMILFFNLYQYLFRKIYETEPNFYSDAKLIKTGLAIVWNESKVKLALGGLVFTIVIVATHHLIQQYLIITHSYGFNFVYLSIVGLWSLNVIWTLYQRGFYIYYPVDIHLRFHFSLIEIFKNYQNSLIRYNIQKKKVGKNYHETRKDLHIDFDGTSPNIYLFLIESYGSYYFLNQELKQESEKFFDSFQADLEKQDWKISSNLSTSPVTGGQSWLAYSSLLYGISMTNTAYYENYLHDKQFRSGNSLLKVLQKAGYTNYNLNPTTPIKGVNVPYDELKEFYCVDHWLLKESFEYTGDTYGFGKCPADQFSMNYMMDIIKEEQKEPFTYFYLTKNSHSPFDSPELVPNWKELNHKNESKHHHKGFLKQPNNEDYSKSIVYQLDNLKRFISDHGKDQDIFLVIGDHQPPVLSDPNKHGLETPIHIISKNSAFNEKFNEYGFTEGIPNTNSPIKHEAVYSALLRSLIKTFGKPDHSLPEYEPDGIQL